MLQSTSWKPVSLPSYTSPTCIMSSISTQTIGLTSPKTSTNPSCTDSHPGTMTSNSQTILYKTDKSISTPSETINYGISPAPFLVFPTHVPSVPHTVSKSSLDTKGLINNNHHHHTSMTNISNVSEISSSSSQLANSGSLGSNSFSMNVKGGDANDNHSVKLREIPSGPSLSSTSGPQFNTIPSTSASSPCFPSDLSVTSILSQQHTASFSGIQTSRSLLAGSRQSIASNTSIDYGKLASLNSAVSADTNHIQLLHSNDDIRSDILSCEELDLQPVESRLSSSSVSAQMELFQPPPHFSETRESVLQDFKDKQLYLFLDYDGTLTPIVSNPCDAVLSQEVRDLIYHLAADCSSRVTVGIVTGRALSSVKHFVQITATERLNFIYAASHGFHIEAAGKKLHHKVGSRFIPFLKSAAMEASCRLGHIPGVVLEDNEFAVSVHYRNAPEGSEAEVERLLDNVLLTYPSLKKTRGKKVFEIRINVVWDKGRAVSWLLNAMNVDPHDAHNRIVYVGDDLTDEDAFHVVRQFDHSLSVLVSDNPEKHPTAASCFVDAPNQVADLLRDILTISTLNNTSGSHLTIED